MSLESSAFFIDRDNGFLPRIRRTIALIPLSDLQEKYPPPSEFAAGTCSKDRLRPGNSVDFSGKQTEISSQAGTQ